ncbi:MAG: N-acetyltransferase, partial [Chryseobacterium sp.]
ELYTARLKLGKLEAKDILQIVRCANNRNISENTLNLPYPYTETNARFWIEMQSNGFRNGTEFIFGIYTEDDHKFVGGIGLHLDRQNNKAELGYWIAEPFWNRGYATEAAEAVLKFGFDTLKLNKIFATHFLHNPSSGRIMQKIGMKKEAELRQHYLKNGKYLDAVQYAIMSENRQDL